LLLALGHQSEARRAYEHVLTLEPHRARSVFGAARSAELAGDRAAALERYQELLRLMAAADGERTEIAMARAFVERGTR
jgi:predicted TPR repeat methyltransferase